MKLATVTLAAGAAIATLAFAAPPVSNLGPAPPRGTGLAPGQCVRSHDLQGHTIADPKTLLMGSRTKGTYRVTMAGSCLSGAMPSDPIITRNPPGSDMICKPIDMDIAIARGGDADFESKCIVESIVKLTDQEVAALPKKLKP